MKKNDILSIVLSALLLSFMASCNHDDDDPVTPDMPNDEVKVTTYTPQDITSTTVVCGGDVIVSQGLSLNELGVCWSTGMMPTVEDAHRSTTTWNQPFVCTITGLEPNTVYRIRAYALRGLEYYYGETKSFTTESGGGGGLNGHDYVDLGLPSGTLWATCDVGADSPEDQGDYFAWGETTSKNTYEWSTYQYCNGSSHTLTKYCFSLYHGYNGFTDNLTILLPEDDAATANWGNGWCMPTKEQWQELINNTTVSYTTLNGVYGCLFTALNSNALFLPAVNLDDISAVDLDVGCSGSYWSSSLDTGGS